MKTMATFLALSMALPAMASSVQTITLRVDRSLHYDTLNANFDGSLTVTEPMVKVNGKKMYIQANDSDALAHYINNAYVEAEVEADVEGLRKIGAQSITAVCKLLGRDHVVSVGTESDTLGNFRQPVGLAQITKNGQLSSFRMISSGGKIDRVKSVTCR